MERQTQQRAQWARTPENPFFDYNFMEIREIERDRAVVELKIRPESRNPYGYVHGGALYTMADNATGLAAHSDGRSYVTRSGDMHFLSNQTEGVLTAEARVRHRGRTACLVEVSITGADGTVLATGAFDHYCVDQTIRPL